MSQIKYPSKLEIVDKLKYMTCDGNIMLEPRLQEYLKKKIYYKENNIEPCIPLEHEFQITNIDKNILRDFLLKDKRDVYDSKTVQEEYEEKKSRSNRPKFPSSSWKKDSRVPYIETNKDKNRPTPINRGMFVPEKNSHYYEDPIGNDYTSNQIIDPRDFPPYEYGGEGVDMNNLKFNPRPDPRIDRNYIPNPRDIKHRKIESCTKYSSQYKIPVDPPALGTPVKPGIRERRKKHCHDRYKEIFGDDDGDTKIRGTPEYDNRNNYKNYQNLPKPEIRAVDERYGNMNIPTYSGLADMDLDNKTVTPTIGARSKEISTGNYRFEPYFGTPDCRDTQMETELIRGMPSYRPRNRSYGYRNAEENQYQYLDEDFQNPDNSVEPWERGGTATRNTNKELAKNTNYTREIMY